MIESELKLRLASDQHQTIRNRELAKMWDSPEPKKKKKTVGVSQSLKYGFLFLSISHKKLFNRSFVVFSALCRSVATGCDGSQAQRVVRAVPAKVVGVRHRCGCGSGAAGPVRQPEPGWESGARRQLLQQRREGPSTPQDAGGEEGEGPFPGVLLGSGENPAGAAPRSAACGEPAQHG